MSSRGFAHKGLADDEVLRLRVKSEIRKRLRGLRKTTPAAACAARSAKIVANLEGLEIVHAALSVALFWPIEDRHEVDLRPLDAFLRARGVAVHYPTVRDDGAMVFVRVADPAEMQEHALGFQAPLQAGEESSGPDVIVVPAIAIDPLGHRIGYGAGYYDRALRQLTGDGIGDAPVTVGVAFDFQLIPEVPAMPTDVPVEWVVTDQRVLRASRAGIEDPAGGGPRRT